MLIPLLTAALTLLLGADALRRIYDVGQEANDHFVAALVLGCVGFYAVQALAGPPWLAPAHLAGIVGIWGYFFCVHRAGPTPTWARWLLGGPSQLAYAYALWAGLLWLLRAPFALALGAELWWAGAWNLLPLLLALVGGLNAWARRDALTVHAVQGLPFRLVQLSDLHVSGLLHRRQLEALLARAEALEPALIVITGDLVMPFSEREHGYLIEALAALRTPVLCCAGNHDLPVLAELTENLQAAGAPLLVDRAETLALGGRSVEVLGARFHWREARAELEALLAAQPRPEGCYSLLLAHDPRLGAWVPEGRFDLVLSGHTHGGHVATNALGIPGSVLRLLGVRDQGWWPAGGGRHYVHRGNWSIGIPPRMGVSGEIALFTPAP
ncbi:MAG: metallophosphoesterase [Alphaproteobacteria bacterium]|nr:metallophosphoesterase [Alphaproteobacteria bacterium]